MGVTGLMVSLMSIGTGNVDRERTKIYHSQVYRFTNGSTKPRTPKPFIVPSVGFYRHVDKSTTQISLLSTLSSTKPRPSQTSSLSNFLPIILSSLSHFITILTYHVSDVLTCNVGTETQGPTNVRDQSPVLTLLSFPDPGTGRSQGVGLNRQRRVSSPWGAHGGRRGRSVSDRGGSPLASADRAPRW